MLGWSDKGDNTEKYEHDVVHGGECFVLSGVPSEHAAIQQMSVHHSQAAALVSVY